MPTLPGTVEAAYPNVDPYLPLRFETETDRRFYVECSSVRGGVDEIENLARNIERSTVPQYSKQLFTGHIGCGKTTELFRLKRRLEADGYFVVYFDADNELDLNDIGYPDILLAVARQTQQQLSERANVELDDKLLEVIAGWFGKTIITEERSKDVQTTLRTEFGLGVDSPVAVFVKMLAAFSGEIKNSRQRREEIRRELENNAAQLIQYVNELIDDAQVRLTRKDKRGLVLMVDGLERVAYRVDDKTGISSHELLFFHQGSQLRSPNCHVLYTFPINLAFNSNINIGQVFPEYVILPMIKPDEAGRAKLRQIIASRLEVDPIFESPDLLDKLVAASGGHVRDLLRLVRYALNLTDTKVSARNVEQAVQRLVNEYDRITPDADLPRLYEVHDTKQVPTDPYHALLLQKLLVLEYLNHTRWADVHPAVLATQKFQKFAEAQKKSKARPRTGTSRRQKKP
jgi:hypothetical protein